MNFWQTRLPISLLLKEFGFGGLYQRGDIYSPDGSRTANSVKRNFRLN
jgi:hypothetical protein